MLALYIEFDGTRSLVVAFLLLWFTYISAGAAQSKNQSALENICTPEVPISCVGYLCGVFACRPNEMCPIRPVFKT